MSVQGMARTTQLGLAAAPLQLACRKLDEWTGSDRLPAAALCVGRRGKVLQPRFFGRYSPEDDAPELSPDALFLVASITKPLTATAVMILVERGEIALEDRVADYLPDFAQNGKDAVRIRHLLTHTSGLPDQLPDNDSMRAMHRPLSEFVEKIYQLPLAFPPGTAVSYQSTGFAILGEIVHQVAGLALPEFLHQEIFDPLGMNDTSLGWNPDKGDRIAAIRIAAKQAQTDWHWNTPYWLGFGAPWGGLITSPFDLSLFCQMMLDGGTLNRVRILSPATVRAMTTNQLQAMTEVPEAERRCRPWGLGWRLNWPGHSANFGDLLGPRTYGHWGATGTLCWIDPDAQAFCILLTTQPQEPEGRFLARVSNLVATALI